ncbi:exodeoxyribonuclease VII large subunit [Flammeovirga sp. EKP202]|uniref:exodeoxyribonuclease VII large subunit n=1 Tax=Flammeovirga sp. EKP202 TaxID=2770592 RepID=UPI00165FEFBE|nr:exodeoxyribonuclease VII large subunit [Flammeovirga sp. EKP202]MBD0402129.1 exodeoxyribonuclease VII large subunit [Flammeovirga sp. EKP202]
MTSGKNIYSLSQLNRSIELHLLKVKSSFWIKTEIAQLQYHSGYAFLELIEKNENQIIARNRATIWNPELQVFRHRLKSIFDEVLKVGVNVLVEVSIKYHAVYGLSLQIEDIDETFSIGELERIRKENIAKLEQLGAFEWQKQMKLPIVPQRIAVISSSKAAGFEDFKQHLLSNKDNYKFSIKLFKASVQGQNASEELIAALHKIDTDDFDVVVMIRGGGAKADLVVFDDYHLSYAVAKCGLPVLSGIGHERDLSIVDRVAFENFKTPTAVAHFLLDKAFGFEKKIDLKLERIHRMLTEKVHFRKSTLKFHFTKTLPAFQKKIEQEHFKIEKQLLKLKSLITTKADFEKFKLNQKRVYFSRLSTKREVEKLDQLWGHFQISIKNRVKEEQYKLSMKEVTVKSKDPMEVLALGYSMTLKEGKLVDPQKLKKGDKIQTHTHLKIIESIVDKVDEKL